MGILRFIAVFFCCLSFAGAGYASVAMPCCMGQKSTATMEKPMPCHGDMGKEQQKKSPAPMKICKCACAMQQAALPQAEQADALALESQRIAFSPIPALEFQPPIDAPPRAFS